VTGSIQLDMFSTTVNQSTDVGLSVSLMRPHKWAHGPTGEIPLVHIEVVPHESLWVWATCLNSHNGAAQSYNALPKWGKFARSKLEAVRLAVDEARAFTHRATMAERQRINQWLGDVLSMAI